MNKNVFRFVALTLLLSQSMASRSNGNRIVGAYSWKYTFKENEALLVKIKNSKEEASASVKFYSNFRFEDSRKALCGNDIFYNKTGRYYFSRTKLVLNYLGGSFSDNVGGSTSQVYVLGRVHFKVTNIKRDTIFLIRIKGNSEKTVRYTEIEK